MAVFQIESGVCHGRGFSGQDPNGLCAKLTSFLIRPPVDGSPATFTADAATDVITCAGHGHATGAPVKLTNSGGALPAGLALLTEYYVINATVDTLKLASTYANATAVTPVPIDITGAGTGTHSIYANGGGAGWYVWENNTDLTARTFATTDVNTTAETITIAGHGLGTGRQVIITSSGTVPGGITASTVYWVVRVDADTIKLATNYYYYAYTAQQLVNITSQGTGTHTLTIYDPHMIFCDTLAPTVNDLDTGPSGGPPKFVRLAIQTTEAAYIRVTFLTWYDKTIHMPRGVWTGHRIATYDDADFAYDIRAGAEQVILHTRLGTEWDVVLWDEWTGDANLVEGTDKKGTLQSGITAGDNVVLQLDTGEAANFTVNSFYYLLDYTVATYVQYVKVTARDTGTDQITLAKVSYNYPSGSKICAYGHRWFGAGNNTISTNYSYEYPLMSAYRSQIPYYSYYGNGVAGYAIPNQASNMYGCVTTDIAVDAIYRMNPDDMGYYACMRPLLVEQYTPDSGTYAYGNRAYGVLKNVYVTRVNSMMAGVDGRIINSKQYLYFETSDTLMVGGDSSMAAVFLDSESTS